MEEPVHVDNTSSREKLLPPVLPGSYRRRTRKGMFLCQQATRLAHSLVEDPQAILASTENGHDRWIDMIVEGQLH